MHRQTIKRGGTRKTANKNMAKIIIESKFEHFTSIYQIELICSKYGKEILFSAFADKNEALEQIEWYKKYNYKEEVYERYGVIYDAGIREITLYV